MKVSIITVVFNNVHTIRQAIESVLSQDYLDLEYIVVDGASSDGTVEIVQEYRDKLICISEKDRGLYDAMNKGIRLATGDIVGVLNGDDFFYDKGIISEIVKNFNSSNLDAIIGDVIFVDKDNTSRTIRRYSSKRWRPSKLAWGFMPPHPSFFVRRTYFEKYGYYKTDYKIAADYELMIRMFLIHKLRWKYLSLVSTKMRTGGTSTRGIKSLLTINKEIFRACLENNVYTNYLMIYSKYFLKPFEFIFK